MATTRLITGTTSGIGALTAEAFARRGDTVLLHGRRPEALEATRERLVNATGNTALYPYAADLSRVAAVHDLADRVLTDHPRLDTLVNNAGVGQGQPREGRRVSPDGYELAFAVNTLAPFILMRRLLERLEASAPARILNVASIAQAPVDLDDLMLTRRYDGFHAYARSKLALILLTREQAERVAPDRVTVNALHPGTLLDTKMVREEFGGARAPADEGRDVIVHLATDPSLAGETGRYFDQTRPGHPEGQIHDAATRRRLWEQCSRLGGVA